MDARSLFGRLGPLMVGLMVASGGADTVSRSRIPDKPRLRDGYGGGPVQVLRAYPKIVLL
jgi:hypothetical protein